MPSVIAQPSCVVILFSIHFVLKAENLCKKSAIAHDIIPVPREISSDCGMALEFSQADQEKVLNLLRRASLPIAGLYLRCNEKKFRPLTFTSP